MIRGHQNETSQRFFQGKATSMTRSSSKDHSGISYYSCVSFDRKSTVTRSFNHPDYASYGVIHQTTLGTTPVAHIRLDLEQRMLTRQPGSSTTDIHPWYWRMGLLFSRCETSISLSTICSLLVTNRPHYLKTSKHFLVLLAWRMDVLSFPWYQVLEIKRIEEVNERTFIMSKWKDFYYDPLDSNDWTRQAQSWYQLKKTKKRSIKKESMTTWSLVFLINNGNSNVVHQTTYLLLHVSHQTFQ